MSGLHDLAEQVRADVANLRDAKATGERVERLAESEQAIDALTNEFRRRGDFVATVDGNCSWTEGREVALAVEAAEALVDASAESGEAVARAAELQTQLRLVSEMLRERGSASWLRFTGQVNVSEQRALFEALAAIPALREKFQDLAAQARSLESSLEETNPPSGAQFRMLRLSLSDLESEIEDAKIGDLPELPEFLRLCVIGVATLRDLRENPDVLDWIVQQEIEDHFFLRPGKPKAKS